MERAARTAGFSAFACLIAALASAGCASAPRVTLRVAPRAFTPADYARLYATWTRDSESFEVGRLENVLHATATYESWEFRWAYVVRYADDYSLDTDTRTEMLRTTLADAELHHRFFLTLVGDNWRESDLTAERSAWRVLLLDDHDHQVAPVEIERITRPSVSERTYFPTCRRQRFAFRVVFPVHNPDGSPSIPVDAKFVRLRMTGPHGTVDLRWDFVEQTPLPGVDR